MDTPTQGCPELLAAVSARDVEGLRIAVANLNLRVSAVPVLAKLLLEDWHDSHEDIVFELGLLGDSRATESISLAAAIPREQLVRWGNYREFQRKCAYALARIGTPESRAALEAFTRQSDSSLAQFGEEALQKWPLK